MNNNNRKTINADFCLGGRRLSCALTYRLEWRNKQVVAQAPSVVS